VSHSRVSRIVRVAAGQGFWGDDLEAPVRQVEGGPIDYLMLDYLAEVTMSILRKQRERDPSAGYARDFVALMERIFPACVGKGIRVVTNAGGVNPRGCAEALVAVAKRARVRAKVALVTGDDLMDRLDALMAAGHPFVNMETDEPLSTVRDRVRSANAYLGARPIVEALALAPHVVVTGRCSDAALAYAPLMHEFGWAANDWNRIAAGVVAGHIIECGAQSSGGNAMPEWWTIPDLAQVGFPIVEAEPDGDFVVTKHQGSGGRVDRRTVTEQLVYEIGDPERYITPDAAADFTSLRLTDDGPDRVRVTGVKGAHPPDHLKVSMAYTAGWKAVGTMVYTWPDAAAKARAGARVLRERLDRLGLRFDAIHTELVGWDATLGHLAGEPPADLPEVQLRVGVRSHDAAPVERFTREMVPLVLTGPPSATGYAAARAKVQEVMAYWPALIPRGVVESGIRVDVLEA
jgi:hypothetical protein